MTKPLPDTDDWLSKLRLEAFLTWKRTLMVPLPRGGRVPMLQTFSVPASGAGVAERKMRSEEACSVITTLVRRYVHQAFVSDGVC